MSASEFRFHPPRRTELWHRLALTMSQAAALTGVSERQIQHWMDRGYISSSSERSRKINGEVLDEIVLIRQARMAGIPLRQAVRLTREYLHANLPTDLDGKMPPTFLREVEQQLVALHAGVERVHDLLHDAERGPSETDDPLLPVGRSNRV